MYVEGKNYHNGPELLPPGGAWTRVVGLSVIKLPQFWLLPVANLLEERKVDIHVECYGDSPLIDPIIIDESIYILFVVFFYNQLLFNIIIFAIVSY